MEDHQSYQSVFNSGHLLLFSQAVANLASVVAPGNSIGKVPVTQNCSEMCQEDRNIYYFNMFFSPKGMANSIQRRNDNLEMLNFQNSDEEPDDVFNRRKKRVADLISKDEEQLQLMLQIKHQNEGKFLAIIDFVKFFCLLKEKLVGIKTDYYSTKTFCALKNASEDQLNQLTKVMHRMYFNVMGQKEIDNLSLSTNSKTSISDQRTYEFLIIPRFLISREKINRLAKDEQLQRNFEFLVSEKCLGHYNNEANKKMPEEAQMVHVRQLLNRKEGRQKFKKICSINHGNKFLKIHPQAYYELYSKSLQYLRQLDNSLKKGKKYEQIKKDLGKMVSQSDEGNGSGFSFNQNQSSGSMYNLKGIDDCLIKMEKSSKGDSEKSLCLEEEMRDQPADIEKIPMKKRFKKLMSMPEQEQSREEQKPRGFCVRKSHSMQPKTTQNIILVPPPLFSEI